MALKLDEEPDIKGEVGHANLRMGPSQTDRADHQPHGLFLHREDMLDRSATALDIMD